MVVPGATGPYKYVQLSVLATEVHDAPPNRKLPVNVWAAVTEATAPRPSKGTDYVQNVYILDPSLAVEEGQEVPPELERLMGGAGVEVMVFSRQQTLFVQANPGDIIRIHRAEAREFNGKLQLTAGVSKGKGCHYCLFDGAVGGAVEPKQRSSESYTMTQTDRQSLELLREFYAHHGEGQVSNSRYLFSIHDLEPNTFVDIICQVVAVELQGTRHEVFYVWDGTDAKPYDKSADRRKDAAETDAESANSTERLDDALLCRRLPPYTQAEVGSCVVPDFPEIGSTLPVNLYKPVERSSVLPQFPGLQNKATALPDLPAVGRWVKLKNLLVVVVEGQLQGLYTNSSKWTPWRGMPADMRGRYEERFEWEGCPEWGPRDSAHVVAWPDKNELDEDGGQSQVTSLRQILMGAGSGERRRFKCFVRIVDYLPRNPANFCRSLKGGWQFAISLHLEDATAELDAVLVGRHGTNFFRGCPEMDLSALPDFQEALKRTMLACTSLNRREGGEWMGCFIERIYPDPNNSQENVDAKYRLVNTVLEPLVDTLA